MQQRHPQIRKTQWIGLQKLITTIGWWEYFLWKEMKQQTGLENIWTDQYLFQEPAQNPKQKGLKY